MAVEEGTCRCCLAFGVFKTMQSTLTSSGHAQSYVDMLTDAFALTLAPVAAVQLICDVCAVRLCQALTFKKQILESEESFLKLVTIKVEIEKIYSRDTIDIQPEKQESPSPISNLSRVVSDVGGRSKEKLRQGAIHKERKSKKHTNNESMNPKSGIWASELMDNRPKRKTNKKKASRDDTQLGAIFQAKHDDRNTVKSEVNIDNKLGILQFVTNREPMAVQDDTQVMNKRWDLYSEPVETKNVQETDEGTFSDDATANVYQQTVETEIKDTGILRSLLFKETKADNNTRYIDNSSKGDDNVERKEAKTIDNITIKILCLCCCQLFKDEKDFNSHKTNNTCERKRLPQNCFYCDTPLGKDSKVISEHMWIEHNVISEFPEKHLKKYYRCDICKRKFTSLEVRVQHINNGHLKCAVCEKTFRNIYERDEHAMCHSASFPCSVCNEAFATKRTRNNHLINLHGYRCIQCNQRFTPNAMTKHKIEAHGAPTWDCQACDRTFLTTSKLKTHQRRDHMLERNKQCPHCDFKAYCTARLKKHIIKHSKEREFMCRYCSKTFARPSTLSYHERIHTGDKRQVCKFCQKAFVQRASLKYHLEKNHPNEV